MSTACIQLEKEGFVFKIKKSVEKGDPLFSKLAMLEIIFKEFGWGSLGICIDGRMLTH